MKLALTDAEALALAEGMQALVDVCAGKPCPCGAHVLNPRDQNWYFVVGGPALKGPPWRVEEKR